MWLLTYEADLPEVEDTPNNKDVASRHLTVLVNGQMHETQDLPRAANVVTFEVPKDSTVKLTQAYADDDGNIGPASESQEFTAVDTIPPDAPGAFGEIRNIGEREVADPEPTE